MDTLETAQDKLIKEVQRVQGIRLIGMPSIIVLDEQALMDGDIHVSKLLAKKIRHLAEQEHILFYILSKHIDFIQNQLLCDYSSCSLLEGIHISEVFPPDIIHSDAISIIGSKKTKSPECSFSWYVGPGNPPEAMLSCDKAGPEGTNWIIGLLGTALVQERAGAAFRSAGVGSSLAESYPFDQRIFEGIENIVAPPAFTEMSGLVAKDRLAQKSIHWNKNTILQEAFSAMAESFAPTGAIAAAPVKGTKEGEPNYWFHWQRDAAMVAKTLIHLLHCETHQIARAEVERALDRYVQFTQKISRQGQLDVSRYTIEGEPILTYGNPQIDGTALTALVLSSLPDKRMGFETAKPYLEYLCQSDQITFDLWEFSVGKSFNSAMLTRRALRKGAEAAGEVGDSNAARRYEARQKVLERELHSFIDYDTGQIQSYINPSIPWMDSLSKLDMSTIGSILICYDIHDDFMNVESNHMQSSMKALENAFGDLYPINREWHVHGHAGMGIGRFPEDMNDGIYSTGGNPWTHTTLWAAQYYYRLAERAKYINHPDLGSTAGRQRLCNIGDGYLAFVLSHVQPHNLSEQIDRRTGEPRGAIKLAEALAELIETLLVRAEVGPNISFEY